MKEKDFDYCDILGFSPDKKENPIPDGSAAAVNNSGEEEPIKKVSRNSEKPPNKNFKLNEKWILKRNSRLQLLIPAETHSELKKRSKKLKVSLNELCNQIFDSYLGK